jgi:hypothetical protein
MTAGMFHVLVTNLTPGSGDLTATPFIVAEPVAVWCRSSRPWMAAAWSPWISTP